MRVLIANFLLFALTMAGAARAQDPVPYSVILVCSGNGLSGPEVLAIQPSADLASLCERPSSDNVLLCSTLDTVAPGLLCANALADLNFVGARQSAQAAKKWLPSNFRFELGDLPSDTIALPQLKAIADAVQLFDRQADIQYVLKSADNAVSLVSCDFSTAAGRVANIDSMSGARTTDAMSCVDALQERHYLGETVVQAVRIGGWDPIIKVAIDGNSSSSFLPEINDEVLMSFLKDGSNRTVYVYDVLARLP